MDFLRNFKQLKYYTQIRLGIRHNLYIVHIMVLYNPETLSECFFY